jgi:hypothetical protein
MRKKSVISLISYDAEYLPDSILSYYDYVDEIVLGLDEDRITWSGNKFSFDEAKLYSALKAIDVDNKISIIEHNFHHSKVALENDNFERNYLKSQCTNDWIFSVDADETLLNSKDFFLKFLPLVERYNNSVDLLFTWFLPYKEFDDSYLVIANEDNTWFRGDTQGFVTHKNNEYTYCRWTNNRKHLRTPLAVLHWSFCRKETKLDQKLNNFGHSDKTAKDPFLYNWKLVNLDNYTQLRNFKTSGYGANQWEKLVRVPKKEFLNIANQEARRVYT